MENLSASITLKYTALNMLNAVRVFAQMQLLHQLNKKTEKRIKMYGELQSVYDQGGVCNVIIQ